MKIVHIGKYLKPYFGGIETVTEQLCEGLANLGHDVHCLVSHESRFKMSSYSIDGYQVIKKKRWGRALSTPLSLWLAQEVNRLAPDIVHVHLPNPLPLFMLSHISSPIIATYHASILNKGVAGFLYRYLYQQQLKYIDNVVVTSEEIKQEKNFLKLTLPQKKISTIPIGIKPPVVKKALNNNKNTLCYFFSGRLVKYKGLSYMVKAMKSLPGELLIAGDGPEKKALKKTVNTLGLQNRVKFLGALEKTEIYENILACDLFVLPSISEAEAFGVSALEAMSLGCPVLTTRLNSGVASVNQHLQTGVVVSPKSEKAIVQGIRSISDKDTLTRLGKRAHERYNEHFTYEQMIQSYEKLYKRAAIAGDGFS